MIKLLNSGEEKELWIEYTDLAKGIYILELIVLFKFISINLISQTLC